MKRRGNAEEPSARADGPSVGDTLRSDRRPPPPPLFEERSESMGDEEIPFERYTSRSFFEREVEALWPKTWQWVCREEHLREVGDHYVYEVGPYSVIVVRAENDDAASGDSIRAYLNSCSHRGTKILAGPGSGYCQAFTCPFHGWSWNLDGSIKNIPARWDFPHVREDSHGLQRVQCDRWGGFVFINMDPEARPLSDYLDVLPEHFAHFPLENRRISVHVEKILPANWKAAQEAFMEAYHNFETHDSPNGANAQYDIFGKYVTRFIHNVGKYSPEALGDYPGDKWRRPPLSEGQLLRRLGIRQLDRLEGSVEVPDELPEGETARALGAEEMRRRLGEESGVDFSKFSDSLMLDSIEYHLFPNMFFFPGISIPMAYRFRPNGDEIDSCIFDLLLLELLPEGASHPEPPEPIRLDVDQSYTEVEALGWLGPVYDEDTGNLRMQQEGFKTSRLPGLTLGRYQEARIRRLHMTLGEFLDR
jgi:nitrite reductase/ring-hydroxylating ferredoxin subunit